MRGVFGWSFYADPSAENWAEGLLEWARQELGITVPGSARLADAVLGLLRAVPLVLVLDGLEVVQEGPAGGGFGCLLDGALRKVLAGACQLGHGGLVLLTSRFPFADLEGFDGTSARMLEVPPFTPAEGAALLAAAGGGWLPEDQRRNLVRAVDGHALATGVLAGLLADHPPAHDLAALRAELDTATRTDARVGKVLDFYAARLAAGRYLLAAVSLFARPVPAEAVLAVAGHQVFGSRLAGWTPAMVRAAVRDRLGGLASWHPDGTISAHPLVRDTFRRLVMDARRGRRPDHPGRAPGGHGDQPGRRAARGRGHRAAAGRGPVAARRRPAPHRAGDGEVWKHLPAARLGQRAVSAFVATSARRTACAAKLGPSRLSYYLNDLGLWAIHTGDLATAREYLPMAVRRYRDAENMPELAMAMRNLAECLGHLGQVGPARDAAAEALTCAEATGDRVQLRRSHAFAGWVASLAGDVAEAERLFTAADQIEVAIDPNGYHLHSLRGIQWAEWLARTGRPGPARALTGRNAEISRRNGWNADLARCDRMLGRLALAAGDTAAASEHLAAAAGCFRDGDYLTELATMLADLADCALASGDPDAAERHAAEAITIAAPRGLIPAQSAALAARARIRAAQAAATAGPDLLFQGRDAADAALRLATRHQLAWHELDALRAHALLDQAEGTDRGWAARAGTLHARLVPPDLDPDPLATVERLVAAQKPAEATGGKGGAHRRIWRGRPRPE